jgi:group I intron endonuclease
MSTLVNSGVYLIRCIPTDLFYVGSTKNFTRRWYKEHLPELKRGIHDNAKLQTDWNAYGESAFTFEPFIRCSPTRKELRKFEQMVLDSFWGHCYNENPIACVPPIIRWRTPEWNANVAAALTGIPLSEEHKASLRAGWVERKKRGLLRSRESYQTQGVKTKGRKQSPEWVAKRTAKLRGRTLPESQKQQISKTLKGKPASEGTAKNLRKMAAERTPEYTAWLGRKGAAKRWGRPFTEPAPTF